MLRHALTLATISSLLWGCAAPVEQEPEALDEAPADELGAPPEASPSEAPAGLLPHGLHFVISGREHAFVVLDSAGDEAGAGPVELVSGDDSAEVQTYRVALDEPLGPEPFVLFGHEGEKCRVAADDVGVLRRAGFETAWGWKESEARDPEHAWQLGESGALLVARVRSAPESCRGAVWASSGVARTPSVFARVDERAPAAALAAYRQLPEYQAIQAEYDEPAEPEPRPAGPWDRYQGATPTFQLFRQASTGRTLVLVSAAAGAGCGDFGASLWALFERRAAGLLVRAVGRDDAPTDVLDADGDGNFELFSGEHASFVSDGERVPVDIDVPFSGCGC